MADQKIPWWMPQVGSEIEKKYINQALDNNYVNEGPLATQFEEKIAQLVGSRYAVVTTSCTVAIFLALKAVGIKPGDEVIVPDLTFIATASAVELAGAIPVLVDVNPDSLTISVEAIKKAITDKTRAIVPVHVTGRAADLETIQQIADENNLAVVEDAAEALMSKHHGKYLGTFGKIGCYSFSPNKTITTGQGGIAVTNDENLYRKMRELKDQGRPVRGTGGDDLHNVVGYNFKFTDLQAALGIGQLTFLLPRIERMKRNYQLYYENLKDVKGISIFKTNINDGEVPQWTDIRTEKVDDLVKYLKNENIDCRKYWLPVHQQLPYKLPDDNFPNSSHLSPQALWLPSAFTLTDEDILKVCEKIKQFFY